MVNRGMAFVLVTAVALAAGAALPRAALALTLETPLSNPDGTPNFADDQNPKYDRFRNNLSGQTGDGTSDGQSRGLTFGSPDSGLTFTVGPQRSSNPFNFNNDRFYRPGPPGSR